MLAEDPQTVRVALRLRPAVVEDTESGPPPTVRLHVIPDSAQVIIGKEKRPFTFDHVLLPESSQEHVYQSMVAPLISQFVKGYNATVFAYGQTYSGKTFTMGSDNDAQTPSESRGIIPRAIEDIFLKLETLADGTQYHLRVSFLEIYQEQIRDLLIPEVDPRDISIRESKGVIVVAGIHEEVVHSSDDLLRCLEMGGRSRSTGGTQMNSHSSRSHAIFTITLELRAKRQLSQSDMLNQNFEEVILRRSKLHLVDLAGSERLKRTGAEGVRLKESVKINTGLLALGNVISVLGQEPKNGGSQGTPGDRHVPYRDSKLTRLLQDSLGGNSKTLMIACVSPLEDDVDESLNTLKYANRARKIRNKPIVNVLNEQAIEFSNMQSKIEELQQQLTRRQSERSLAPVESNFDDPNWMLHFMEELKTRTLKGANAIRELQTANEDKMTLEKELESMKSHLQFNAEEKQELHNQLRESQAHNVSLAERFSLLATDLRQTGDELDRIKKERNEALEYCARLIKGEDVNVKLEEDVRELIDHHLPHLKLRSEKLQQSEKGSVKEASFLPPIGEGVVQSKASSSPSKIPARIFRRKTRNPSEPMVSEESMADKHKKEMKQLEDELFDAQKRIKDLEEEISKATDTKALKEQLCSKESAAEEDAIVSVKVLTESGSQTDMLHPETVVVPSQVETYGVEEESRYATSLAESAPRSENGGEPQQDDNLKEAIKTEIGKASLSLTDLERYQNSTYEDLVQDLSAAIKAKVDLLKDLTRAGKETERMRHQLTDKIQKLERELEASEREKIKFLEEIKEKDASREKAKEEHDRKVKHYEGLIAKMKSKQKEQEKSIKDKDYADRKSQEMHNEVEKASAQLATLKKKAKEDAEKFAELDSRKSKELASLNKQCEDAGRKIRHLENLNETLRKKLDRKTEENTSISKKLKDSTATAPGLKSNRTSVYEISKLDASVKKQDPNTSVELEHELPITTKPSGMFLSETEITRAVDDIDNLAEELQVARSGIDSIERKLDDLDHSRDFKTVNELKRKRALLLHQVIQIRADKQKAEESLQPNNLAKEKEVDDTDYGALLKEFENDTEALEMISIVRQASLPEMRQLVIINLRELIHLKKMLHQKTIDMSEMSLLKGSKEEENQKLTLKLQKAIRSYEKKLVAMEQSTVKSGDISKSVSDSNVQAPQGESKSSPEVVALEKDLFYYRQTNRDLKAKLRELVAKNQKLQLQVKEPALGGSVPVAAE